MRTVIAGLLCLSSIVITAPTLRAQTLYGSIVGTVTDQSGAVVPNAQVKAVNPATGETRETTADEAGRFSIGNVVPGNYDLKVSAPGFRLSTKTGVGPQLRR
jgi:protocatechuate 3,4-dioxygenase beta subunit